MEAASDTRRPERRYHAVFVTHNTEYHVRRNRVVAVRARGANEWRTDHKALFMKVSGHVEPGAVLPLPGPPAPGDRLYLEMKDKNVITSVVEAIERPQKEIVAEYPHEELAA